jgi:aspartate carbamoyltransferase catalytic subunit
MNFKGADIISIREFSKDDIIHILDVARDLVPAAKGLERNDTLSDRILATIFFEPSTRTRLSFEAAMHRLGGKVVSVQDPRTASAAKGETLSDTVRMVESYSDMIVLRHPQEGSARLAAEYSTKPVINAGDGAGQHPTQTLLDLFTVREEKGTLEDINVALVGDLKYGRTVHSLSYALALFGANLHFVAPPNLQMPREVINAVEGFGSKPDMSSELDDVLPSTDVLYVTRIQKERFPDPREHLKVAGAYRVDSNTIRSGKKDMIVMHPLPRVTEILPEVDKSPNAVYFKQAFNGIPVRMAILSLISGMVN